MRKPDDKFTSKEIATILNNAVAVALHPDSGDISDARLRNLRHVALAMVEPLQEMLYGGVDEQTGAVFGPCMRPEELVAMLACAALFMQTSVIMQTDKLPHARISDLLFKKTL